jgi:hypothetical protein
MNVDESKIFDHETRSLINESLAFDGAYESPSLTATTIQGHFFVLICVGPNEGREILFSNSYKLCNFKARAKLQKLILEDINKDFNKEV